QYWRRRWPRGGGGNGSPPPGPSPQPDPPPLPSPRPSPPRTVACPPPPELTAAERLAVSVTTNFETGQPFACRVSPTSDPDGISMGMIQWNLRAKTLQSMIRSFEQRGGNLDRHFRALMPSLRELLGMPQSTRPEVDAMIARARQFRQAHPTAWQAALLSLCGDPVFCRLQVENLRSRLAAAHRAVRDLGLGTVRGLTMMFDIQVGDGYAARFNNRMVSGHKIVLFRNRLAARRAALRRELGEREKLIEIADEAASFAGRWQDERRARRLVIANGTGIYRRSNWNLDRLFPGLDRPL
ncbi:MAG TPA: hypothetical protein PKD54_07910, partial [Pirellulaceae bacterium]|nr:hypothetical protein [Pirellulaceae bacterium]